jgi:molybdenum-dependent DNA-binding transcriptional regulator ModE
LTTVVELQGRIEKATRTIDKSYRKTLKAVEKLKEKINETELRISRKGCAKTSQHMDELNSAIESLNSLSDSLILRSESAWNEYNKLERDCRVRSFEPAELNDLRVLCKKTEELAANLLCYSLAHFRQKDFKDERSSKK